MDSHRYRWLRYLRYAVVIALLMLFVGCTPRTYLIVDYQVPGNFQDLQGQQVRLLVTDSRSDRYILAPAAARQFEGFQDRYSLAWITEDEKRTIAGEYDLQGLLQATFQKRLEALGVTMVEDDQQIAPLFQVDLLSLKIDQDDHKWIVHMSYTASLSRTSISMRIASETIEGRAERTKIIGRKGADKTLSDIFSDVINQLDIVNLFKQAGLI